MNDDAPTNPGNEPPGPPPSGNHERETLRELLAAVVEAALGPFRAELFGLRSDLGLTNGTTRGVLHRLTDLEERVARLENADTERPSSYADPSEPGGDS
jgi:hypothetical protein